MHPAVEPVQERDGAVVSLLTALDGEAPAMFPYNSDTEEEDSPQSVSDECPVVLLDTVRLVVAELQCKIGNRIYVYPIGAVGSPSWRLLDPKRVKEPDIL